MKPVVEDTFRVLTSDLLATDYDRLIRDLETRAVQPGVIAVDFSDTQFVVLRQHDDAFAAMTNGLDLLIPTSRPLIWAMKQRGSEMAKASFTIDFRFPTLLHRGERGRQQPAAGVDAEAES